MRIELTTFSLPSRLNVGDRVRSGSEPTDLPAGTQLRQRLNRCVRGMDAGSADPKIDLEIGRKILGAALTHRVGAGALGVTDRRPGLTRTNAPKLPPTSVAWASNEKAAAGRCRSVSTVDFTAEVAEAVARWKADGDPLALDGRVLGQGEVDVLISSHDDLGYVSFRGATFGDGDLSFRGATFGDGDVSFRGATFGDGDAPRNDKSPSPKVVSFRGATFGDGHVSFNGVNSAAAT